MGAIALLEKLSNRKTIIMIVLLFTPLFLVFLGLPSLWDQDENVYAEISRQMVARHDYVGAYFNDDFRPEKPPLNYWINAGFYHLFGINEFATRLGSCLFGLLGILLIYCLAKRLFSKRTAILASLMLGTSFIYFLESQLAIIDTTLTFFISLTLYWFYLGYFEQKSPYLLWMGFPLGLGILAKGPVALILTGSVGLVCWFLFTFRSHYAPGRLFNRWLWGGLALAAAVCLPWYLMMWFRYGMAFIVSHFGYNMFQRFTQPIESHGGWYGWFYYFVILIVGFIPWSAQIYGAFRQGLRHWDKPRDFFLLAWAALIFGFFTISQTKLPGYILPVLPPVAVLVGHWWDELFAGKNVKSNLWIGMSSQIAVSFLFVLLLFINRAKLPAGYEYSIGVLFLLPLSLAIGALVIWGLQRRSRRLELFFEVNLIIFYLFWALFLGTMIPIMENYKPIKYLAQEIHKVHTPGDRLISHIRGTFGAPFYTRRHVQFISSEARFLAEWRDCLYSRPRRILAMVEPKSLLALERAHLPYAVLAKHGPGYLITNRPSR